MPPPMPATAGGISVTSLFSMVVDTSVDSVFNGGSSAVTDTCSLACPTSSVISARKLSLLLRLMPDRPSLYSLLGIRAPDASATRPVIVPRVPVNRARHRSGLKALT